MSKQPKQIKPVRAYAIYGNGRLLIDGMAQLKLNKTILAIYPEPHDVMEIDECIEVLISPIKRKGKK